MRCHLNWMVEVSGRLDPPHKGLFQQSEAWHQTKLHCVERSTREEERNIQTPQQSSTDDISRTFFYDCPE